ncbi:response regulator transcription factor [Pseudonocardia lutea]|uniref:Response regulator transcription factor n=1 Tax=Pseudonocardia lutea TaxID=2172015 RepID=A0ABW1IFU9_9PSEU
MNGIERQTDAYAAALRGFGPEGPEVVRSVELTPRELAVLGLLAEGMAARAIARRLGITPRTVQKHLERCYTKLGVSDRISAVLRAQRFGLVLRNPSGP